MIDKHQQGKGYGKASMELMVKAIDKRNMNNTISLQEINTLVIGAKPKLIS